MNCNQAQAMLATYRELRKGQTDTTELVVHLEQCAACRWVLAQYSFIGEQIRSLPTIEPSPSAHTRLMNALAAEHLRYTQRAIPGTYPTPEFLKPYLQEYTADPLVAFSSAETGPLPIIHTPRKRHHRSHVSQLVVIGLAAAFLMVVMMSGITTLLLLVQNNTQQVITKINPGNNVSQPAAVVKIPYTTSTPYRHIVSAVADNAYIYSTAYGDNPNDGWMLQQLDRRTRVSTPLLATVSSSPLIILGSSNSWLVWLQFDPAKPLDNHKNVAHNKVPITMRTWSLHYLSLTSLHQKDTFVEPLTLTSGTFNSGSSPNWVYTPVQGIWFIQSTLLFATIDENGISHLLSYQLDAPKHTHTTPTEIATASPDHVFTSPTANGDGTEIYWSDEWRSDDGTLHSNIWTQQVSQAPRPSHGRWAEHRVTVRQLFRSDGASFYPEVVDNTLFLLSTADATSTAKPGMTPATTPVATSIPITAPSTPTTSWADPTIYIAPLDESERGTLLMLSLDDPKASPTSVNLRGQAWSPRVGTDFVLWQTDQGYEMYDVSTKTSVSVGNVLDGARFLAVNGNTTVWTIDNATSTATGTGSSATLMVFNWPMQ